MIDIKRKIGREIEKRERKDNFYSFNLLFLGLSYARAAPRLKRSPIPLKQYSTRSSVGSP